MASRHSPRWATLMPNSTCDFASVRASAKAGDDARSAATNTNMVAKRADMIEGTLTITGKREQGMCHDSTGKSGRFLTICCGRVYETRRTRVLRRATGGTERQAAAC